MKKGKVLIIEPNRKYATGLGTMLRKEGFSVKVVSSEINVDMFILAHEYDVIFIDIHLWKAVDSFFIKLVKNVDRTKIILTSEEYINDDVLKGAISNGVFGCVHKPFKATEVFGILAGGTIPKSGRKLRGLLIASAIVITLLILSILRPVATAHGMGMIDSFLYVIVAPVKG